ncbi:acyltransferase domain-containing protein [Eubacterium ramulus]
MNHYKIDKTEICHDWQENLIAFSKEHEFPEKAVESLSKSLSLIIGNKHLYHVFSEWEQKYWKNPDLDYVLLQKTLEDLDGEKGISKYTFDLLFMIGISRRTWELYQERGISREIFHDSMADMHWKLLECHRMYGIWGTFVMHWFPWWFQLKRFALGRLQFELIAFDDEYEKDGLVLHKSSPVINVHIPSCGKLDYAEVQKSYEKAAVFYRAEFTEHPLVFVCESWLLFPANKEILSEHSNIRRFLADYDVYRTRENNKDLWRIYYGAEQNGFEHLPESTGLERAYKNWLLSGHMAGQSWGVYRYGQEVLK